MAVPLHCYYLRLNCYYLRWTSVIRKRKEIADLILQATNTRDKLLIATIWLSYHFLEVFCFQVIIPNIVSFLCICWVTNILLKFIACVCSNLPEVSDSMITYPRQRNLLDLAFRCHSIWCGAAQSTIRSPWLLTVLCRRQFKTFCSQWTEQITTSKHNIEQIWTQKMTPVRDPSVNEPMILRVSFVMEQISTRCTTQEVNFNPLKCRVVQGSCNNCSGVTLAATMADMQECSLHTKEIPVTLLPLK